jgi:hypothetical protein
MIGKLRRWSACAILVVAITATPILSACHPTVRPRPVIRGASYSVLVTSLDSQTLSGSER